MLTAGEEDIVYDSQAFPPSVATAFATQQQQQKIRSNSSVEAVLAELGQELSCAICLSTLQDAVTLPCAHFFCRYCNAFFLRRECLERSITIKPTKRESNLSTSSHCPLCKMSISKRSIAPAVAINRVAKAYGQLVAAWELDTGRGWNGVATDTSRSKPTDCSSQAFPCPLKEATSPAKKPRTAKAVNSQPKSPIAGKTSEVAHTPLRITCITSSLLSKAQHATLLEWTATFGIAYDPHFDASVEVLLVPSQTPKRTLKYCRAVLTGKWILSFQWIEDCLAKGELLSHIDSYEAVGDERCSDSGAPRRARLLRSHNVYNYYDDGLFM